jgi:hypothetical protein
MDLFVGALPVLPTTKCSLYKILQRHISRARLGTPSPPPPSHTRGCLLLPFAHACAFRVQMRLPYLEWNPPLVKIDPGGNHLARLQQP